MKQFKSWKVLSVIGSTVVVGALIPYALLHSMCYLKVKQMNMQHCLIWEPILYEFEPGHNTKEATKNICCVKMKGHLILILRPDGPKCFAQVARTLPTHGSNTDL